MPTTTLCLGHVEGFSPSQVRKYDAGCPMCVKLRGHLPPGQRDAPALAPRMGAFMKSRRGLRLNAPPRVTAVGNLRDVLEDAGDAPAKRS